MARPRAWRAVVLLAAALLVGPGMLAAATVSTLDGRVISGPALVFAEAAGTVTVGGTTLPLSDCDWLEPGDGAGLPPANGKALGVWLADGSWMPATALAAAKADDVIQVTCALGTLTLPLASIHGWSPGAELPGAHEGGEVDVVQLDSGVVTGRVDGLKAGALILHSDLDPTKPLSLPIEQVRALCLSVPAKAPRGLRLSVSLSESHAPVRLVLGASGSADQALCLAAAPQVAVGKALMGARLRIDGGRRVYLSELTPEQVEEVGAFGVVWPWTRDRNLDGTPLKLGGIRYDRGIVVHSQAKLEWNLAGAYEHLHALVGIADIVADQGDCEASLVGDGTVLWHRESVKGGDKPLALELDLTGVRRLELHGDYGARFDIGDHLALADAYLVKSSRH
jgi:hypothetical protein